MGRAERLRRVYEVGGHGPERNEIQHVVMMRQTKRIRRQEGFTLVELMVVMLIIGVLAAIAIPSYISSLKAAREAVLKEDLHVMRQAIDSYTMDKEKGPQSLDDLVQSGYLKEVPNDPMTHTNST